MGISLTHPRITAAFAAGLILGGCASPGAQLVASGYDGAWQAELSSKTCGTAAIPVQIDLGGLSRVQPYPGRSFVLSGVVLDDRIQTEAGGGSVEYAEIDLRFASRSRGAGTWRAQACSGTLNLQRQPAKGGSY